MRDVMIKMLGDELMLALPQLKDAEMLREYVESMLRRATYRTKRDAYEEAATVAEKFSAQEPWYDTHSSELGEADAIAASIRELKDSPAQETASSMK